MSKKERRAFTLIELMIVVAIIALIATIAICRRLPRSAISEPAYFHFKK